MIKKFIALGAGAALLAACATASDDVRPTFQSASIYEDLDCKQIAVKMDETLKRVQVVSGKQDFKRKVDQASTGVGVIILWPALFLLLTPDHKRELGELKGQYEALSRASEGKHCRA